MKFKTLYNIVVNARKPRVLPTLLRKVATRLHETGKSLGDDPADAYRLRAADAEAWARAIEPSLWDEALEFVEGQHAHADALLAKVPVTLGGGGFSALLYFLVRVLRPEIVVETGVAAGHSSRAFLSALEMNGSGHLYSSDFPYFRLHNPERYIGLLVEAPLRSRWTLLIDGDRKNLPRIAALVGAIDLFHYDSDKSVAGREFALHALKHVINARTVVVFDDIQDNSHFLDIDGQPDRSSIIFEFRGKFIGMIMPSDSILLRHS